MKAVICVAALLAAGGLAACAAPELPEALRAGSQTVPAPASPITAPAATEPASAPTGQLSPLGAPPSTSTARPSSEAIRGLAEPTADATPADRAQVLVRQAMDRLTQLAGLHISLSDISLVSAEPAQWRDTSLGCPRPGMVYAQVITPGYKIVLKALGKEYEFHTDRANAVVLCFIDGQDARKVLQ